MKSIKEKAKAYDEAIKKAKDMLSYKEVRREDMEYLFPELKESEDERIRKALIVYLKSILSNKKYGDKFIESWIAWLEKQCKNNMGISETTKQKLEDNLNKALEKETPESCNEFLDEQGEQKPAWSEEDERLRNSCISHIEEELERIRNDKYGHSEIISDLKESCRERINWLKFLKDRVQPQPKQEWSEEYEKRIKNIEESLLAYKIIVMDNDMELANYIEKEINWLKSLKDRYTWKPSNEQMDAIKDAIDYFGGNTKIVRKHLMSLYDQLKKLKE